MPEIRLIITDYFRYVEHNTRISTNKHIQYSFQSIGL